MRLATFVDPRAGIDARFGILSGENIVDVVAAAQYDGWIHDVQGRGGTLDKAAYTAFARPSENGPVISYGQVTPGLFETISQSPIDAIGSDQ